MTEDGHKYTQAGFDGPYWEAKERRDQEFQTGWDAVSRGVPEEPDTEVTWVGESGITWVFVDVDEDYYD